MLETLRRTAGRKLLEEELADAEEELEELRDYAESSGHLTNRYKAGRRVRDHAAAALDTLRGGSP